MKTKPLTLDQRQSIRKQYFADQTLSIAELARQSGFTWWQVAYAVNDAYRNKHMRTAHKKKVS